MKLSVKELKEFKKNSAFIKNNGVIGITSYLKFENNTVTKNAMHAFCIQELKCSEACLIDEKILFGFLEGCTSTDITVKIDEKSVTLIDKHRKTVAPTDSIDKFPASNFNSETIDIPNECSWAVLEASHFSLKEGKGINHMDYVYVGAEVVGATNGTIFYVKKMSEPIPEIVLDRDMIAGVFRLDNLKFSESERFYYFQSGNCKYGFVKQDQKFWDMSQMANLPGGMPKIEVNKAGIIAFNDYCTSVSNSLIQPVKMSSNKKNIDLSFEDSAREFYPSEMILANAQPFEQFLYIPRHMTTLLKSLPDSDLTVYRDQCRLFITGESGAIAIISEVTPTPKN